MSSSSEQIDDDLVDLERTRRAEIHQQQPEERVQHQFDLDGTFWVTQIYNSVINTTFLSRRFPRQSVLMWRHSVHRDLASMRSLSEIVQLPL